MHGILEKIVDSRKESFKKQVERLPAALKESTIAPRSTISKALQASHGSGSPGIIAEIKRASPSKTFETQGTPFDIQGRIKAYAKAGVQAISVLTEPLYFQGSFDDLLVATSSVTIPVLCKDFIVLPEQLDVAAKLGASNVLIIVKLSQSLKLIDHCLEVGLEPLLEVHDEEDLFKVIDLCRENNHLRLVGMNNRNLNTLDVDISISKHLIPIARNELPRNTTIVSESGIKDVEDVASIANAGAHGFLIGTTFMNAPVTEIHGIVKSFQASYKNEEKMAW